MLLRAGRRRGRCRDVRNGDSDPVGDSSSAGDNEFRERARWLSPARAAVITVLAVCAAVMLSPGNGASGFATRLVRAVRHLTVTSRNGQAFRGIPAVGALFTTSAGSLGQHYCTASVIDSPGGDLAITAAHCVTGTSGTIDFIPGFDSGATPYGVWTVTKVYVDQAWRSSADPDDDFAIVRVSQADSSVPVEDVTGAEQLLTGAPAGRRLVEVIGYPSSSSQPVSCQNRLTEPMVNQLEFDCGGYPDGTSGGPFLTDVDQASGQGMLIGVIGGYEQGGYLSQISYSSVLGANAAALYRTAVAGG